MYTSTRRICSVLMLVGLAVGLLAAPSSAAESSAGVYRPATLAVPGGVLYPGCHDYPYTYQVDPSLGTQWRLTLSVFRPDGREYQTDVVEGSPSTGKVTVRTVCQLTDGPGRYFIRGVLNYVEEGSDEVRNYVVPASYLVLRKPSSRTTLKASDTTPKRNQVVTLRVRSQVEKRSGWAPNRYAKVSLQLLSKGKWTKAAGLVTNKRGVVSARWQSTRTGRFKWRAVTVANGSAAASTSKVLTIRR